MFIKKKKNIMFIDGNENIIRIKQILKKIKIKSSDKLAILSYNCPEFALLVKACWDIGIIVIPVNIKFNTKKIHSILKNLGCSIIIVGKNLDYSDDLSIKSYPIDEIVKLNNPELSILNIGKIKRQTDRFSNILFSSGTQNVRPKIILHSLHNHYYSALGSQENINFDTDHTWLVNLPMYHISGFSIIMRCLLKGGNMGFAPKNMSLTEAITNLDLSHLSMVPTMLYRQFENKKEIIKFKKLFAILVGGAPIPVKLIEEAVSFKLPIFNSYGSSEMSSQISATMPLDSRKHLKTSGKVLRYREVKISKDNEILVRGKTLFKGYIENDRLLTPYDKNGWFKTGDLGYFDNDNYLHIEGRKDSMFISGGENLYPEEIENELLKIPGISDSLIVPFTDQEFGDISIAFIKTGQKKKVKIEYIKDFLNKRIEHYKIPKYFLRWPRENLSGIKPSRNEFKEIAKMKLKKK